MPRILEDALLIYTDGSLYPRDRKGGYGAVFIHVNGLGEDSIVLEHEPPGIAGTTGNRMELQACIDAFRVAPTLPCFREVSKIAVRTDSRYVTNNYMNALGLWRRSGWRTASGRPVDNADLWKEFVRAHGKIHKRILIEWVKGHGKGQAKDPYNYRADKLAKSSANSPLSNREFRSSVRRKIAPGATKAGSVRLLGQTMTIYIIEVQRMRVQKTWKYRYQVVSPESADLHAIDWIYSSAHIRDGHCYEVRVNDDMRHPQIVELMREIPRADVTGVHNDAEERGATAQEDDAN